MKVVKFLTVLTMLTFVLTGTTAFAASTKDEIIELKEEVKALKAGQESMKSDLAEIKKLLESGAQADNRNRAQAFEPKDVSIAGAPIKGEHNAKITLIEYSDYQCPFCRRHAQRTMPNLLTNYVETGKVKFVMREFPLTSLHPRAVAASLAALCARDQDKYWEMHDVLFANQKQMSDDDIKGYAEQAGVDVDRFVACMDIGKYNDQVQSDLAEGRSLGITGTPSFAIGVTDSENADTVKVMKVIRGAKTYDSFVQEIESLLPKNEDAEPSP